MLKATQAIQCHLTLVAASGHRRHNDNAIVFLFSSVRAIAAQHETENGEMWLYVANRDVALLNCLEISGSDNLRWERFYKAQNQQQTL